MDTLSDNSDFKAGSTKRKELHGTIPLRALTGSWVESPEGAVFHACKITFTCDVLPYPDFVLLTESKLDDDVATSTTKLYLLDKIVDSSASPCGQVRLCCDEISRAMCFHELLFNGLFGKLFKGSKTEGTPREFLTRGNDNRLWTTSYTYLILPLASSNNMDNDSWAINWAWIDSCVSVVEFMKNNTRLTQTKKNKPSIDENINITGLHLANRSYASADIKDTVVMSIHAGRIYYVAEVLENTSAESPFDASADKRTPKYSSYADYFSKKYGIILFYPKQPLLHLKQTHNPFNLLIDCETHASRRKVLSNGGDSASYGRAHNHVQMPPELLVVIDIPVSVLRACYLIPSLMHRLETLMLAAQLREEIGFKWSNSDITSVLVLEALTTLRCCEEFSSERLELLGDSVLKYTVSAHVFLNYPHMNEGELSGQRQRTICNATLYELGVNRGVQEYVRDGAFEPRRWVAPGQVSVLPSPCLHNVEMSRVPVDEKYLSVDETIILGKSCDKGHRWMVSKSISDCVEALIGAYYVGGGLAAAIHVMRWLGIEIKLEPSYVDKAIAVASEHSYTDKIDDEIVKLESKVGYEFSTKGLLLEAITCGTEKEVGPGYCYERLEFLGDAVLDLVITWYLYRTHKDVDPGELTDLRSAVVNNENFARVAISRNLYQHFRNCPGTLFGQITDYAKLVMEAKDEDDIKGKQFPKALGDLVESIAGAILVDTKLEVDRVWEIYEPMLSPIATPDSLELPPFRELTEMCDRLGYFFKERCSNENDMVIVELRLQLKDVLLLGEGIGKTKKVARGQAALYLLNILEKRGVLKRKNRDSSYGGSVPGRKTLADIGSRKKHKTSRKHQVTDGAVPIIEPVNKEKGGPRTSLYELCKRLQWPMPSFEATEQKSTSPIEFFEGINKKVVYNSYTSKISLYIPDYGAVDAMGEPKPDKKTSQDSAALNLLYKLEKLGKLKIGC